MSNPTTTRQHWQIQGQIAWADTGSPAGGTDLPCVAMVHGAVHNRSIWAQHGRWLAEEGFATFAPDLPGHGESGGQALGDVAACADWLLALLAQAGVRRAVLAGHSMGALVALEAAARSARGHGGIRVEALVLLGAAVPMKVAPAMLAAAEAEPFEAIDKMASYSHARGADQARDADRALMRQEQSRHAQAGHGNLLLRDLALCDAYAEGLQAATAVACPSTLIVGQQDRMTPAAAAGELALALKAQRVELATGHNLMAEDPEGVQRAFSQACAPLRPTAR
jgi:pimeloyl-ACP methyl ester carboxylesterase